MLKFDEKIPLESKVRDFEWSGEVFKISMINMFSWFYYSLFISEVNS